MGLFLLFSPLIFLSYELSRRKILPKDFYNFAKGFIVYLINMLVLYLLKKVFLLHYQPISLFLYVFTLDYLVPQVILVGLFFLLCKKGYFYEIGRGVSDFVIFSVGFYFFDAIVHFLMEYNRYDPFILFVFPLMRLLMIMVTAVLFGLIRYRDLKIKVTMVFVYLLFFSFLALPEVLYDLNYFFYSFLLAGILFTMGTGVFIVKAERA